MIIYADILFLLNAFICYGCLMLSAVFLHSPLKRLRFLCASLLGGLYSLIILVPINTYLAFAAKIAVCFLIILIAFGKLPARVFFLHWLIFLLINTFIAGVVLLLSRWKATAFYSNLCVAYFRISPLILILSMLTAYVLVRIAGRVLYKCAQHNAVYKVIVSIEGKEHVLFGFCDTGNHLTEPFSALPVCVVKEGIIPGGTMSGTRVIPYAALGAEGVLYGYKADISIFDGTKFIKNSSVYLASNDSAFNQLQYDIILSPKVFE